MSPERITNFIVGLALISFTTLLRSAAPVELPTCVSEMSANLKLVWAKEEMEINKDNKNRVMFFIVVLLVLYGSFRVQRSGTRNLI
jgi:hypothetical protein